MFIGASGTDTSLLNQRQQRNKVQLYVAQMAQLQCSGQSYTVFTLRKGNGWF